MPRSCGTFSAAASRPPPSWPPRITVRLGPGIDREGYQGLEGCSLEAIASDDVGDDECLRTTAVMEIFPRGAPWIRRSGAMLINFVDNSPKCK